jgi:hypothetical protein
MADIYVLAKKKIKEYRRMERSRRLADAGSGTFGR